MENPAAYRNHAAICIELARRAAPADRARLLSAAEAWRSLAERAEQRRVREAARFGVAVRRGPAGRTDNGERSR
jgi:hypothetical protein